MDRQAWKVLKCLYPDSIQLETNKVANGCLICAAEAETVKKAEQDKKEEEKVNRKKPLECPLVRSFYTRGSKGYPLNRFNSSNAAAIGPGQKQSSAPCCPLQPGVYACVPRSWCHRWRKYIKTGEGKAPPAPDASELLCDAHNLPLIPPHLESFLRGETSSLLGGSANSSTAGGEGGNISPSSQPIPGYNPVEDHGSARHNTFPADAATLQALRAAGLSEVELHAQRIAMAGMQQAMQRANIHDIHEVRAREEQQPQNQQLPQSNVITNEQLDRENRVVVEILTDEEIAALEKWWPGCHGTFALRFAIVESVCGSSFGCLPQPDISWSISPCRECDPSSCSTTQFAVRSRHQKRGYR